MSTELFLSILIGFWFAAQEPADEYTVTFLKVIFEQMYHIFVMHENAKERSFLIFSFSRISEERKQQLELNIE